MGLKMLYQGQVIDVDKIATRDPTVGTKKFNIKINATSTAKYGLTSDTSASKYCNFNAILDNKKVYFGTQSTFTTSFGARTDGSGNPYSSYLTSMNQQYGTSFAVSTNGSQFATQHTSTVYYSGEYLSVYGSYYKSEKLVNQIFAITASKSAKFVTSTVTAFTTGINQYTQARMVDGAAFVTTSKTITTMSVESANSVVKNAYATASRFLGFRAQTNTAAASLTTTLNTVSTSNQGMWITSNNIVEAASTRLYISYTNRATATALLNSQYSTYRNSYTYYNSLTLKYSATYSSHRIFMVSATNATTDSLSLGEFPLNNFVHERHTTNYIARFSSGARSLASEINPWGTDTATVSLKFTGRAARTYRWWSSMSVTERIYQTVNTAVGNRTQLTNYELSYYMSTHTNTLATVTIHNMNM